MLFALIIMCFTPNLSDIKDKSVLCFLKYNRADNQRHNRRNQRQKIGFRLGRNAVQQNHADKADNVIQRIHFKKCNKFARNNAFWVENRRCIHPKHADYAPQKLRVTKKHHSGGKQQADSE